MRQRRFRSANTASFVLLFTGLVGEAAPTVTDFTPALGKPGTQVVIRGSGFSTATEVKFDTAVADFSAASDGQMIATVPPDATSGPIRVTNPTGPGASISSFLVAPRISDLEPPRGATNTTITIRGFNFDGTTNVLFNNKPAAFAVTAATQIRALVPFGATNGPITVMTPAGLAMTTNVFLVIGPAPIIDEFAPGIGGPGTFVQITGVNFTNVASVKFNGLNASFSAPASSQINAQVPPNATTGKISVTTGAGTATSTNDFIVTKAPVITIFFPSIGKAGQTQVVIEGLNLGPTNNVTGISFAGVPVSGWGFTAENQISVTVPSGATSGPVRVTNTFGTGVSSNDFIVTRAPIVMGFEPTLGAPGDRIRIDGINFTGVLSPAGVKFNGLNSKSNVVTADTQLFAYVPNNATTGPLTITNSFGAGSSSEDFTVIGNLPVITDFSPNSGARGTPVTINGKNFIGPVTVKFNGVVDVTTTTAPAPTQIRATVPANATTGPITVTTSAGISTNLAFFFVPPRLTSFTPTNGVVGNNVVITGANFTGVTAVLFNAASAAFSVNASNKLTAVVPTNATTGPLTVTTPAGVVISTNTFQVLPNITSFSPTLGPVGTLVAILGTSFLDATNVSFNNVNSAGFTVVSSTEIRANVPQTAMTGLIRVSAPGGTAVSATNFLVTTASDLALAKSASVTLAKPGEPLTYTLVVTNKGPSTVTGVTLTDMLPEGVTFVSANSTNGPCTLTNDVLTCNIGVLANNAGFTVSVVVVPSVEAVLNNTATISSVESDPNPGNNTASAATTVILDASRTLRIGLVPGSQQAVISWPVSLVPFTLQSLDFLSASNVWLPVTNVPAIINLRYVVTNEVSSGTRFFRLIKP
jgi:uncharacterized repeat protein (TIGR01451 family)